MPAKIIKFVVIPVAALLLFGLTIVLPALSWHNNIENEGIGYQTKVSAQYDIVKESLSSCLDMTALGADIAEAERSSLRDILIGVVTARSAQSVDPGQSQTTFLAMQEAYPEISDELYRQLMTTAIGCRKQFSDDQHQMIKIATDFEEWMTTGGLFAKQVRGAKFPTDGLVAIGPNGQTLTGSEALAHMKTPIILGAAEEAAQTGTMPQQTIRPRPGASTQPQVDPTPR